MRKITGANAIAISEQYDIPLRCGGEDCSVDEIELGALDSCYVLLSDEQCGIIARREIERMAN